MATAELTAALSEKGYDCIGVDTLVKDLPEQKFVGVDNKIGITLGMDHLTSLGHRTIALLVNEPEASENVQERIAAFESYSRTCGVVLSTHVYHTGVDIWENSSTAALGAMASIWNAHPRPTAIFAVSDSGAIAAVQWLQQREIRVPEEISVLGFDGSEFGARIHPVLSSVANPFQAQADAVFSLLDDRSSRVRQIFLPPTLLVRGSTTVASPTFPIMSSHSHSSPLSHVTPAAARPVSLRGFTLVEMLAVLGIMAILLALVAPAVPSIFRPNQLNADVATLSGILDQAREAATSGNSFVWVAFADPPAADKANGLWVATIETQDGTESPINTTVMPAWLTSVTIPGPNLAMEMKIDRLPGVQLVDAAAGALPSGLLSKAPTSATPLFEPQQMEWTITSLQNTPQGAGVFFNHAIEYAPNGEARVPTWNNNIQFGLVPAVGADTNSALFNISRLTGRLTVYRL